jgi:BASS family bile acid:Na+ symporter
LDPAALLKLVLLLGVVLLVVGIGTRARLEEPLLLLRRPPLALRALLAMYVLFPAVVLLLVGLLQLRQGVGAVLLGFAVSPVLPPWAKKGTALGARGDYVIGLELLSTAVSLLVVPLMIAMAERLFGVSIDLEPRAMVLVLLATVVLPLTLGIGIARLFPLTAPRLGAVADRLGSVVLLIGAVVLLGVHGPTMLAVIGEGTVLAILLVIVFGLLLGELLGGPDRGIRDALASATVSRHPAIALLLATGAFPQQQTTVIGTVLIYLLASILLPIFLMRSRKNGI